jgi:hypothetical protein
MIDVGAVGISRSLRDFQTPVGAFCASTGVGVPSMFDSLEVKVLCPRSGGDEGLARRKGGRREAPSERSAEAKPRPDGQKPNMRHFWSDEQARICEVPYPSRPEIVDSAGVR